MEYIFKSDSINRTQELGAFLSTLLTKGDILLMDGSLGAGKTSFAKGIGKGLGIKETIISPTFNIVRCYFEGRINFYHIDAYRLEGIKSDIGLDEYLFGDGVCLVEWGEYIDYLFNDAKYMKVEINITGDEAREYKFISTDSHYDEYIKEIKLWDVK